MPDDIASKDPRWNRLTELLRTTAVDNKIGIAFSGGLDSRFLSHAAQLAGLAPLLLHAAGPHISPAESTWAHDWATARGLHFEKLDANPLTTPSVAAGAEDRCYGCKHALFGMLLQRLTAFEIGHGPIPLCDGSNLSDRQTYRPGMRAVRELGVRSPLAESGFDKDGIRELARLTGMERPEQRARPCLLTRFAYGMPPNADMLAKLAEAEEAIARVLRQPEPLLPLLDEDATPDFRLRTPETGRTELHIEIEVSPSMNARLIEAVTRCGLPAPNIISTKTISGYYDKKH